MFSDICFKYGFPHQANDTMVDIILTPFKLSIILTVLAKSCKFPSQSIDQHNTFPKE